MTMERAFWLQCDSCDGQWPPDLGGRDAWFVRIEARHRGWHRSGKRDICPECWENRALYS